MSMYPRNLSGLVETYKEAKTPEETVLAILDIVKGSQKEIKDEILRELKAEIKESERTIKLAMLETKYSLVKWAASGIMLVILWTSSFAFIKSLGL